MNVEVGELESSKNLSGGSKKWPGMGEALINCGVRDVCDDNSFSLHAFTGLKLLKTCHFMNHHHHFIIVSIFLFSKGSLTSFHDLILSLHFTLS